MAFNLPAAQYLMRDQASVNRGFFDNQFQLGRKLAGNLPTTTNGTQVQNSGGSEGIYFGLSAADSTDSFDASTDTKVLLTSVQFNAPNRIQVDTIANRGIVARFTSGASDADYVEYYIGGHDTPFGASQAGPVTICLDLSATGQDASGGTYDNSDVTGWGYGTTKFNLTGTNSNLNFFQRVFLFDTQKGGAKIPKFTGASNFDDAFVAVQGTDYTNKIGAWLVKSGSSFFVPCPIQFGDGVTATIFDDEGVSVVSPADNASGQENFRLSNQAMRVYLNQRNNAADSVTLSGSYSWGTAAEWNFDESKDASCTLSGNFSGMGNFIMGSSVVAPGTFTLASGSKVISNGANLDGITVNGDLDMQGSTVTTFTGMTVTGALEFDTAGIYTLDGCTIDEVTNSSGGAVTLNLTNGSIVTTNTGPSITINNPVTVNITVTDTDGAVIENARVRVTATESVGSITNGDVVLAGLTDASGVVEHTAFNYENAFDPSGLDIKIKVRQGTTSPFKKPFEGTGVITTSGFRTTIALLSDE